jgi:hypothetical protein
MGTTMTTETITDEDLARELSLHKLRFHVRPQEDGQVSVGFYHDADVADFRPEAVVNFDMWLTAVSPTEEQARAHAKQTALLIIDALRRAAEQL